MEEELLELDDFLEVEELDFFLVEEEEDFLLLEELELLLLLFSFIFGILIVFGCFNYLRGVMCCGGASGAISGTLSWMDSLDELLLLLEDDFEELLEDDLLELELLFAFFL